MKADDWREFERKSNKCLFDNNPAGAAGYLREAIELASQAEPAETALMFNRLAKLLIEIGEYDAAEEAARRSIAVEMEFGLPELESHRLASFHMMLAGALDKQRKFSEAVEQTDQGIRGYALHLKEGDDLMRRLLEYREWLKSQM